MVTSERPWCKSVSPEHFSKPLDKIITIFPGEPKTYVAVSPAAVLVHTHYVDGRTVLCTADQGTCRYDHRYTSRRAQVWLAVQAMYGRQGQFLPLTEAAVRDCPRLFEPGFILRGRRIDVGRAGKSMQSRVRLTIGDLVRVEAELLPAPDVAAFLERLWNVKGGRQ